MAPFTAVLQVEKSLAGYSLRGREDFFEKKLFGSPSDPESKNIVFIDTV